MGSPQAEMATGLGATASNLVGHIPTMVFAEVTPDARALYSRVLL